MSESIDGIRTAAGHEPWTAGRLRAALVAIPDDTVLVVNVADPDDPTVVDEQIIVGCGFGRVDWGDGYGLEPDVLFGLECEWPAEPTKLRPSRYVPRRRREGSA